jgi:hypothetical protein
MACKYSESCCQTLSMELEIRPSTALNLPKSASETGKLLKCIF